VKNNRQLTRLIDIIQEMNSVLVAYSGGTDSTLLASLAAEVLGAKALAVFAGSAVTTEEELRNAESLAETIGIRFLHIESKQMDIPGFVSNSMERCYFCKHEIFRALKHIAVEKGLDWIADGTNYDDLEDYRPGIKAARESGVRSPLCEAGLSKDDIRRISYDRGLPTWNSPATPCLASRIPYGTPVTIDVLKKIADGERYLRSIGLRQVRLRHHGEIARIEIGPQEMAAVITNKVRLEIIDYIHKSGYRYVTLDLAGFRSGSLNEDNTDNKREQE
jgi:uncharacterized protein